MAEASWPFDDQDSSEAQYSLLLGQAIDTGVLPDQAGPDGTSLRAYADSSGMFVKVASGTAVVRGFAYRADSLLTLAVPASGATARTDSVVLRLDLAGNRATTVLKQGDGGGPPALTQADGGVWEVRLADVTIPPSSTTVAAGQVTDRRPFSSLPWGTWTTATRPAAPARGKAGVNTTTGPEWWDGTGWRSFAATTTDASQLTSGTLSRDRLESYDVLRSARDNRFDAPMAGGDPGVISGDWNRVLSVGMFRVFAGYQNTNAPAGANLYGTLVVFGAGPSISSRTQQYFASSGGMYWRTAWNGNDWGGWQAAGTATAGQAYATQAALQTEADARGSADQSVRNDLSSAIGSRTINQGNAGRVAAGNTLANNFTSTGYGGTSAYSGYVDVTWPGMNVTSVTATAQSGDTGGCTASVTNQTSTGCRVVLVRRNNAATGVNWIAVGN